MRRLLSWQRPRRRNGASRQRGSTSSWESRKAICSFCWPRSACRARFSARGCCRLAPSTIPFISRGLDALNYACYQDARFILVATPSGLALAPEGGAHQSISTPLIGIGQPSLTAFEPAHVDELCEILRWSFEHLQADDGGSVYLRLSTRPLEQPDRAMTPELSRLIVAGGYWLVEPSPDAEVCLVASGAVIEEVRRAHEAIVEDLPGAGLLVITSADRLQQGWIKAQRAPKPGTSSHVDGLLARVPRDAGLVTVIDGHSATLVVAGRRSPSSGRAAWRRDIRAVRQHFRALPGLRSRRGCHRRRRGSFVHGRTAHLVTRRRSHGPGATRADTGRRSSSGGGQHGPRARLKAGPRCDLL